MRGVFLVLLGVCLVGGSGRAQAQTKPGGEVQPLCVQGCGGGVPDYEVQVSPDGQGVTRSAFGTFTETISVFNSGMLADSYDITCYGTGGITCLEVSPSVLALDGRQVASVTVTYSTGGAGVGGLYVAADSPPTDVHDDGSFIVTVTGPGAPVLSLAPYNPMVRSSALCAASCFDFVYSRGTPSYTSLNAERAFAVVYNSAMHRPTPVIQLDASYNGQTNQYPTSFKVEVMKGSTLLTLQNGATAVYFQALSGQPTRLSAAIDARANGLGTGDHGVTVTVTALYPTATLASTVSTRLVVLDETGSSFGAGVHAAGVQRIYFTGGSALVTEGDGSFVLYESTCGSNPCANYRRPGGTSAFLTWVAAASVYRRINMDSSYVEFNSAGRMTKAVDRFANTTILWYTDTLLTSIVDPMGRQIQVGYTAGKLASATVLPGSGQRTTSFLMDASGRLIRVQDPDTYSDSLAYQAGGPGLLATVWNRARARTDVAYDPMNRLASITAPAITTFDGTLGRPVAFFRSADAAAWQPALAGTSEVDRKGGLAPDTVWAVLSDSSTFDPATVRMRVDSRGAPLAVVDPYGATTTFTRDTASRATRVVQPNGHRVDYTYTNFLLTKMVDATLARTEDYAYTTRNDLATVRGNSVPRDFLYYDGTDGGPAGALKKEYVGNTAFYPTITNATLVAWHKPDGRGRDTVVTDSLGHATRMTYDATWGSTLTTKDPGGNLTRVHYDALGRVDTSWAPLSGKTSVAYGLLNQVLSQRTPFGYTTQLQYDPATLALVRLVDPKGQVSKWQYNALGQLTIQHDVADTTRADTLKYDLRGQLRQRVTRRSEAIALTYDRVGRLLTRSGPGFAPDSFRYDPNGLWSVAVNAYAYDSTTLNAAGQTEGFTERVHGTTWNGAQWYDLYKRPTTLIFGNAALGYQMYNSYRYSASTGMLDTLCLFNYNCMSVVRNGDGQPTTLKYGTWSVTQTYSATHQLSGQVFPTALSGFTQTIGRDSLDRVTSLTFGIARMFTYDTLGRLLNACDKQGTASCINEFGGTGNAFSYDAAGNRTDGGAVLGAGNRVTTFRGWTVSYDVVGQVASKYPNPYNPATVRRYVWDALGCLTAVTLGADTVARFRYDALGRRVLKVTGTTAPDSLWFVYNAGAQVLVDLGGNGAANVVRAEYGYAPGGDQVLTVRQPGTGLDGVLLLDPMIGSVRGVAAASGLMKKDYRTTLAAANPWGTTPVDTGAVLRYRWAGREYDPETELYYMRARYYDPQLGRFLSEDPIGIEGGLNLYAYAGDEPVNRADPFGEAYTCWTEYTWIPGGPTTIGEDGRTLEVHSGHMRVDKFCKDFGGLGEGSQPAAGGGSDSNKGRKRLSDARPPVKPRSPGQCFAENTALVFGTTGRVITGAGATVGGVLLGAGRIMGGLGNDFVVQGTVDLDIFFGAPDASSALVDRGIGRVIEGRSLVRNGSLLVRTGAAGLVAGGGLLGAYAAASYAICVIDSNYGSQ
jgi:RHS repeat-associated protein